MKFLLALVHTAVGAFAFYWMGFAFLWNLGTLELPLSQIGAYITGFCLTIIVFSIVAVWVYAIRQNTSISIKLVAAAVIPIYPYFVYQIAYSRFAERTYCNEVVTEQGKKLLCTNEDGEKYYRELSKQD